MARIFKSAIVLIVVMVLQVELFSDTRLFDVMPELLLGTTVAAAWAAGAERGATVGFCAGLLYDLFLPTPLALTALTYVLIGYGVGTLASGVATEGERFLRRIVSVAAVAIGIVLFVILGELLSATDLYTDRFLTIVVVGTLYTALFMPLLHRSMSWAFGTDTHAAPTPLKMSVVE